MIDLFSQPVESRMESVSKAHPEFCDPTRFSLLREKNWVPGYPLRPWPILLTAEESRDMQEKSVGIVNLVSDLPKRYFKGVTADIVQYYGLEWGSEITDLVLSEPNGVAQAIYRGDYLMTRSGLRCLEINGGSGIGAWVVPSLAPLYLEVPLLAELFRTSGVRLCYKETFYELLVHILRGLLADPGLATGPLNVAFGVSRVENAEYEFHGPVALAEGQRLYTRALATIAPGRTGQFAFCDYDELEVQGRAVSLRGRPIHALFEQHAAQGAMARHLFGSFKAGKLALYSGPVTRLLMDKRSLALLSEKRDEAVFDAAERQLIESLIPWTRVASRTTVDYFGHPVFLPDLLYSQRERLVIKRAFSHAGRDAVVGRNTSPAEWSERVARALEMGDWVVQEAVESLPYMLLDDELGVVPYDVSWGLFTFGGAFQGGALRIAPRERKTLLSMEQGARALPYLEIALQADGAMVL